MVKRVFLVAVLIYVGSYALFRTVNSQVWADDGRVYVIFPENMPVLYYAYRPLSYLDGALTGMRFHIGPHR